MCELSEIAGRAEEQLFFENLNHLTETDQVRWEGIKEGVYRATYRDNRFLLNCNPRDAGLSMDQEEVVIGEANIDVLCWAITRQRKRLAKETLILKLQAFNRAVSESTGKTG